MSMPATVPTLPEPSRASTSDDAVGALLDGSYREAQRARLDAPALQVDEDLVAQPEEVSKTLARFLSLDAGRIVGDG